MKKVNIKLHLFLMQILENRQLPGLTPLTFTDVPPSCIKFRYFNPYIYSIHIFLCKSNIFLQ